MIFDKQSLLSDQQAVTATAASTNVLDLVAHGTVYGAAAALPRDEGNGCVPLLIQVTEDFATLTSLTVQVQVDDNAAFSSAKTVATSITIAAADLKAGKQFEIRCFPKGTDERYLRLNYVVTGADATTGKITAGVVPGIQTNG